MDVDSTNSLGSIAALVSARESAFVCAGNLTLSEGQRELYSQKVEELSTLIRQLAEQEISETSVALTGQAELVNVTGEINAANNALDWQHTAEKSADANLGHLSKLIESGKKMLELFKHS